MEYFLNLEPIKYEGKEEAKVPLKEFMTNNVRFNLPAVYKSLIDWPALELWQDLNYLTATVGQHLILAYNYLSEDPYKNFAGSAILNNQVAHPMTIAAFLDGHKTKFSDPMLKDPLDATNLFYQEPLPK